MIQVGAVSYKVQSTQTVYFVYNSIKQCSLSIGFLTRVIGTVN